MFRFIIVIFIFASICFSQQNNKLNDPKRIEGEDIIQKARETISLDKSGKISSYFYKVKTSFLGKTQGGNSLPDYFEEVSFTLPDKIQTISSMTEPFVSQATKTWNGGKYKSIFEAEMSGQRIVKDDSNPEKIKMSKSLESVLGKDKAAVLNNIERPDPKKILKESIWTELFPLILNHPLEPKLEFNYVGKAKSNDKIAKVVDVQSEDGKTYRLLFDTETNYLLMMIVNFKVNKPDFTGDIETKYYFSERKTVAGIMIPKKIKVEDKSTAKGQPSVIKFRNIEILEFKINPEFKKDLFDIK